MATIALSPAASTPRADRHPGRLRACLRVVVQVVVGLADPAELAEAGVAAPGHRGGVTHL